MPKETKTANQFLWPADQNWPADVLALPQKQLFEYFRTSQAGLSAQEAKFRESFFGPNELVKKQKIGVVSKILRKLLNPLVLLLLTVAAVSALTGQPFSFIIILIMTFLSVGMDFIQEHKAERASEKLNEMVRTTAEVFRDGQIRQLPLKEITIGDAVSLSAGDVIPADMRLIFSKDLFISQSSLTGEALPVEKNAQEEELKNPVNLENANFVFMGSAVSSGEAAGLVINIGAATEFGKISKKLAESAREDKSAFAAGIKAYTWLMIKAIVFMVTAIFLINIFAHRHFIESLLFALAVAIGLTPETLPMLVTVNLSKGALDLVKKKVIVKKLASIQNFGAMDILCTDKTGTLTMDRVVLEKYCNIEGKDSAEVLEMGFLNSHFQSGLKNLLDQAVLKHKHKDLPNIQKLDEVPFDFNRKMVSVIVKHRNQNLMITKGEPQHVIDCCSFFKSQQGTKPIMGTDLGFIKNQYLGLSQQGFRVLAVATKEVPPLQSVFNYDDERGLTLIGYLAFLDPPKITAKDTLKRLEKMGVRVVVLTGDNELVTAKICREIGFDFQSVLLGRDLDNLDDAALSPKLSRTSVCCRLTPLQKERIVTLLKKAGHVVGYLGDGINDAPALKAADVGISVNNAADVAKESASLILLKKSLTVLADGVVEGRRVFGNILKYLRMSSSSNFGNMLSFTGANLLLPFLPMAPIQIILNNLLYDVSQIGIPTDKVDEEYVQKPRVWHISNIEKYMLTLGPVSSIFDYATFGALWWFFSAANAPDLFRTGWFLESLASQILVVYIIRTRKIPFLQSRPSAILALTTLAAVAIGFVLPLTGFGQKFFGFVRMPADFYWALAVILFLYLLCAAVVKNWFIRRFEKE